MDKRISYLAEKIEKERLHQLILDKVDCEANRNNCKVSIKEGRKFTRVDVGRSGAYMVDKAGNIFGIKAYGVVHRGHQYGTLDTIDSYWWGEHRAIPRPLAFS